MQKIKAKKLQTLGEKIDMILQIPFWVRRASISLFLFMMGRGLGGDTFFSVYIKSIIGTGVGLTLIGCLLPLVKLSIVIPIGTLNDQGHSKYLLLLGKILYAISALFYFSAGVNQSVIMLIFAVIFNGWASSTMFTTYRSIYGKKSKSHNRSQIFGVYFSSINLAYVIGALISYFLVQYLDLPYMYLFVVIFSIFSILQDGKIQDFIRRKFTKTRRRYQKKQEKSQTADVFDEDFIEIRQVISKKGFFTSLKNELLSLAPRKRMFFTLQGYGRPMYVALASQSLATFINYVAFLFIPLVAMENNLGLPEIAILFAVMKVPYLVNIFIGNLGDRYNKKILITILLIIAAILFVVLGRAGGLRLIVAMTFGLSLVVAILQPITTALILDYSKPQDRGLMAGLQEFVNRIGEIVGALGFWVLTTLLGLGFSFQLLGLALLVLGVYLLFKKLINFKTKDNEAQKELLAHQPLFVSHSEKCS